MRPPSTVSLTVPARVAYDARSQRYPAGARFRYQRVLKKSSGTPTRAGRAASGLTQIAAATVSTVVIAAISVSGTAKRTVRASESTSAVVRETRSPVPARSTVESGSASTRRMKSSRSSAKTFSESTNEARRANQVRIVSTMRKIASRPMISSTCFVVVPSCTDWTSAPRNAGPARPAVAAAACRPIMPSSGRRLRRPSRRACARSSSPAAIGSSSFTGPRPWSRSSDSGRASTAARGAFRRRPPARPRRRRRGRSGRASAGWR